MTRKHILSIGRDSSVLNTTSQFYRRFETYDQYHTQILIVLNCGETKEITVGQSRAILAGGKTLIGSFWNAGIAAINQLRRNDFDLITTQDVLYAGVIGFVLAKVWRLPLYVQVHGDHLDNERWFVSEVGKYNRVMNVIGRFILKRADYIRVVSNRLKRQMVSNYRLNPERVSSIPIGTDTNIFLPPDGTKRQPVIVFAQRLIPEKLPLLFVSVTTAVMHRFPEVRVVIAGDGFLKEAMIQMYQAANLLDRVTFLGVVRQEKLVPLYQNAMVYLHTADWEGWGMPMIEAMAAGCVVVTTDTGCAGEAVRDGETGMVVPIDNEFALIDAIEKLLHDPDWWNKLSRQGVEEASRWSFTSLTKKNMEWYAESR